MTRYATSAATLLLLAGTAACPGRGSAQDAPGHVHDSVATPYAYLLDREIKALAGDDVRGLLAGEGLGFALAAELNGYPGPKHVLELADSLMLTPEQRARVEAIREEMQEQARRLGARLVAAERELDRAFSGGILRRDELRRLVSDAARLRGGVRAAHLEAHLAVTRVLDRHQVQRYRELRGYRSGHGDGHPHGDGDEERHLHRAIAR